jgi:hypothetical protein
MGDCFLSLMHMGARPRVPSAAAAAITYPTHRCNVGKSGHIKTN